MEYNKEWTIIVSYHEIVMPLLMVWLYPCRSANEICPMYTTLG